MAVGEPGLSSAETAKPFWGLGAVFNVGISPNCRLESTERVAARVADRTAYRGRQADGMRLTCGGVVKTTAIVDGSCTTRSTLDTVDAAEGLENMPHTLDWVMLRRTPSCSGGSGGQRARAINNGVVTAGEERRLLPPPTSGQWAAVEVKSKTNLEKPKAKTRMRAEETRPREIALLCRVGCGHC